jgi:hypothetical protein
MHVEALLPVLFSGTPRNKSVRQPIFAAVWSSSSARELSASDMPVVFETRRKWTEKAGSFRFPRYEVVDIALDRPHQVRMFQGALYRRAGRYDRGASAASIPGGAFPGGKKLVDDPGAWISYWPDESAFFAEAASPLAHPLARHFEWKARTYEVERDAVTHAWLPDHRSNPLEQFVMLEHGSVRNTVPFDEVSRQLIEFDADDYESCLELHGMQWGRLVAMDGELWIETPPPTYRVDLTHRDQAVPKVTLTHAPGWHDTRLHIKYFPLSARDEAFEYAERLGKVCCDPDLATPDVVDHTVEFECGSLGAMEFDHVGEEVRRLSHALAIENRRFLERNPQWKAKLGNEALECVAASFEAAAATNYILGEFGDPSPWIEANADIWKRLGRKSTIYGFGHWFGARLRDLMLSTGFEAYDRGTISVDAPAFR